MLIVMMTALNDAIVSLYRSMDANRSLMRSEHCLSAARYLRQAGLHGHAEHCAALGSIYHGDGCGVRRLYDELRDLETRAKEFADSGFSEIQILAGLLVPALS